MDSFSHHAEHKLLDLYNNHDHEVGSQLKLTEPEKYKDYQSTDCITYVLRAISHGFSKTGNEAAAKKVWTLGRHGTELAKYLVDQHHWKGIYINPDQNHPIDEDHEHTYTSFLANKKCEYYKIPLDYKVVNYSVTSKNHPAFQKTTKHGLTKLDTVSINSLKSITFGFGLSRGGKHTWLFRQGKVYEVHWESVGDTLYESTDLSVFGWLSGVIVVPPGQSGAIAVSAELKCG